ncbi:MAG: sugar ABC transporter permease [Clostridia bacterium]|nr:sugar ABC transporter permease [Clostridia bacterium]
MKQAFSQNRKKHDIIFCLLVLLVPMVQFAIFYIGVNITSLAMVFQKYEVDPITNRGAYIFNGLNNFKDMWFQIENEGVFGTALKNSLLAFVMITLVGITFALIFSLYIFKEMPGAGMFRVLLFAPSILSASVTVTIYRFFVEGAVPVIFGLEQGLLGNAETKLGTIIFFNIWIGFGTQILMYSGAMNGIDPSITEAAKLDGANPFVEFFYIILPLIFPTIQTFLVTGVAGIFINQINLVAFEGFGAEGQYMTVGYYLFKNTESATQYEYPLLATYGVALTLIAAPLTLLTRRALEKFGPSVD